MAAVRLSLPQMTFVTLSMPGVTGANSLARLASLLCQMPGSRAPAEAMADYLPITGTSGNFRGLCPDCETRIYRRVAYAKLDKFRAFLDIIDLSLTKHKRDWTLPLDVTPKRKIKPMRTNNPNNERIEHRYFAYLHEAKRLSEHRSMAWPRRSTGSSLYQLPGV